MSTVSELMTVSEAAEFAGVHVRSIYYHLAKSRKLFPVNKNNLTYVQKENLLNLYPARSAGNKQKLTEKVPTRETFVNQVSDMIAQEIVHGNIVEATRLFNIVKNI